MLNKLYLLPIFLLILLIPISSTFGASHPIDCNATLSAIEIDEIEKSPQLFPFNGVRIDANGEVFGYYRHTPNGVFDVQHELELWNELNPTKPCKPIYEHLRNCDTNQDGIIDRVELANWFIFYDVWVYPLDHTEKKMRLFEQSVADRIPLAEVGNIHEAFLGREAIVNGQFDTQDELWYWSSFINTINRSTYESHLGGIPYCEPLIIPEPEPEPTEQMWRFQVNNQDKIVNEKQLYNKLHFWSHNFERIFKPLIVTPIA